jgi:4-amino-4-deoxy-L-arabinose transferase-like glycosyltransferase
MHSSQHTTDLLQNRDPAGQNGDKAKVATQKDAGQTTVLWERLAFDLIVALSAFLNLLRLGQNLGNTNPYYAAAVKSMLMSWHNFFFVAFDPGGFLAVEKPPLGLWIQVASAKLLGFSAWSLLLPEALAGVGSVVVLHVLVRRVFGTLPGLLAALTLALMPISVVTSRDNTVDSILVFTLLLATWVLSKATETGRLRWLLLSAFLVGLGFNIKFLEAYVILPAFAITYLLGAPQRLPVRFAHLVLAGVVLVVVSFSWVTVVDLVPTAQRPYIISTQSNSELEVAIGRTGIQPINATISTQALAFSGRENTGLPGPLRLLNIQLGGQIGWWLFFAICGLIAACRWKRPGQFLTTRQAGLVMWGVWFISLLVFFSFALFYHPYYMVTFAPAICALIGIGSVEMYQAYRSRAGWRSRLLVVAVVGTVLIQAYILSSFPAWSQVLTPLIIGAGALAVALLLLTRTQPRFAALVPVGPLVTSSILVLLIAPTVWTAIPVGQREDAVNPVAGPTQPNTLAFFLPPDAPQAQPELLRYLVAGQGQARYLVAVSSAPTAAPFILGTGKPALTFGGYNGLEQIMTVQQVITMIQQGSVRFFLLPAVSLGHISLSNFPPDVRTVIQSFLQAYTSSASMEGQLRLWILKHCTLVPRTIAEPKTTGSNVTVDLDSNHRYQMRLFDCAKAVS